MMDVVMAGPAPDVRCPFSGRYTPRQGEMGTRQDHLLTSDVAHRPSRRRSGRPRSSPSGTLTARPRTRPQVTTLMSTSGPSLSSL